MFVPTPSERIHVLTAANILLIRTERNMVEQSMGRHFNQERFAQAGSQGE